MSVIVQILLFLLYRYGILIKKMAAIKKYTF